MFSIFKNSPQMQEKSFLHRVIMLLLVVICSSFLLATTIVGIMSNFTVEDESAAYSIFKGIFAITLILSGVMYYTSKKISSLVYSCIVGFVTVLFPLLSSIGDYRYVKSIADKFSMSQDYTAFLLSIGIYLLYAILCVLTGLYVAGYFKWSLIITLLSVVSALATLFMAIDKATTYDTNTFEVLTFASTSVTSLIPIVAVSSSQTKNAKAKQSERTQK